jgi:SP family myo-inositol transporter-like MFS transporter 13
MSITGGQVISYGLGAAFAHVPNGWRYMVGLGAVPALVLAALLPFCPESPRQLAYHGRIAEAEVVIAKIYKGATPEQVRTKVALIVKACEESKELNENESRWSKIKQLHTVPSNLRALICACGLMVISQMSGFNTLMYYSSTLFALVGFKNPVAVGLVVAGTNFVMTWVNMMAVDPVGRRRILVCTVWGMSAGLLAVAVAFSFIPIDPETLQLKSDSISTPAIVVLVFIIWFVFFYGVSVGNTAWMSTDFFPMEVRAMGTMWLTCSCWGSNIIVSSTFLSMMKGMTPSGAFGFYAAICGIGWVLICKFLIIILGHITPVNDGFQTSSTPRFLVLAWRKSRTFSITALVSSTPDSSGRIARTSSRRGCARKRSPLPLVTRILLQASWVDNMECVETTRCLIVYIGFQTTSLYNVSN